MLSGDLTTNNLKKLAEDNQHALFPETDKDQSWNKPTTKKRYYLTFPFYPFRTLSPRHLWRVAANGSGKSLFEFDANAPIMPANTQMDIVFTKRNTTNFINYMLPLAIAPDLGAQKSKLTAVERAAALSFVINVPRTGENAQGTEERTMIIKRVEINIADMYLQVSVIIKHLWGEKVS